MSTDIEKLAARIAALEDKAEAKKEEVKEEEGEKKEASERMTLAAEIAALEAKLAADAEGDKEEKDEEGEKISETVRPRHSLADATARVRLLGAEEPLDLAWHLRNCLSHNFK